MKTPTIRVAKPFYAKTMRSPVGDLTLVASDEGLAAIRWQEDNDTRIKLQVVGVRFGHRVLDEAHRQLLQYFGGERSQFTVPLDLLGTPFQRCVWTAVGRIPYGQVRSYAQIIGRIGSSTSQHALGGALYRNPVGIIIPCHRAIAMANDRMDFAGGIDVKRRLLGLEHGCAQELRARLSLADTASPGAVGQTSRVGSGTNTTSDRAQAS